MNDDLTPLDPSECPISVEGIRPISTPEGWRAVVGIDSYGSHHDNDDTRVGAWLRVANNRGPRPGDRALLGLEG